MYSVHNQTALKSSCVLATIAVLLLYKANAELDKTKIVYCTVQELIFDFGRVAGTVHVACKGRSLKTNATKMVNKYIIGKFQYNEKNVNSKVLSLFTFLKVPFFYILSPSKGFILVVSFVILFKVELENGESRELVLPGRIHLVQFRLLNNQLYIKGIE